MWIKVDELSSQQKHHGSSRLDQRRTHFQYTREESRYCTHQLCITTLLLSIRLFFLLCSGGCYRYGHNTGTGTGTGTVVLSASSLNRSYCGLSSAAGKLTQKVLKLDIRKVTRKVITAVSVTVVVIESTQGGQQIRQHH